MTYNTPGIARKSKTFRGAEGCQKNRVLVRGATPAEAENPAGANAGNLAGVSFDAHADGEAVALSEYGYPEIETAGAVAYGERVNVADTGGRIKAVDEAAATGVTLVGVAEQSADGAGEHIMVNIRRFGDEITV